jgi:hypothetical protein
LPAASLRGSAGRQASGDGGNGALGVKGATGEYAPASTLFTTSAKIPEKVDLDSFDDAASRFSDTCNRSIPGRLGRVPGFDLITLNRARRASSSVPHCGSGRFSNHRPGGLSRPIRGAAPGLAVFNPPPSFLDLCPWAAACAGLACAGADLAGVCHTLTRSLPNEGTCVEVTAPAAVLAKNRERDNAAVSTELPAS